MRRIPASPAPSSTTPAWTPRYDASRATTGTRPLINSPANLAGQTGIGTPGTLRRSPRPIRASGRTGGADKEILHHVVSHSCAEISRTESAIWLYVARLNLAQQLPPRRKRAG
jgi:hypothetical protein